MSLRLVIVGGVAGGMSAAARARRLDEHASITVLERSAFISFANCGLPYHIAGRIADEKKLLVTTADRVMQRFNIDARVLHEVVAIDRSRKQVVVRDLQKQVTFELPYDKLILAPGAAPIVPKVDHVKAPNVFLLRSVEDTRAIRQWIEQHKPQRAVIAGAGFIGLEMAEALHDRGLHVTVVGKAPYPMHVLDAEMAFPISDELKKHGVELLTGVELTNLRGTDERVTEAQVSDGRTLAADVVLLAIGVKPHTELAQAAGLVIGASGAIAVDRVQRTSDPDVYAVGDATEVTHGVSGRQMRIPLAGPANRHGRTAGQLAVTGHAPAAAKVLGTSIIQVFDVAAGVTGLTEQAARQAGLDVETAYATAAHHASYYPGAEPMRIKLVYERSTGRVLGGQAVGGEGVDKRLDVIATTIHFRGTIDDLASLDLAYAPQFGSAKDPIHVAAMIAQNQRDGVCASITPGVATSEDTQWVDVRTPEEFARGTLHVQGSSAVNVPVDDLRQRLDELDRHRPVVVFCQVGLRGYLAARILRQRGFADVRNLKGGYGLASRMMSQGAQHVTV